MANQGAGTKGIAIITLQQVGSLSPFNPVITRVAEYGIDTGAGIYEVVAKACESFGIANTTEDNIGAIATEE